METEDFKPIKVLERPLFRNGVNKVDFHTTSQLNATQGPLPVRDYISKLEEVIERIKDRERDGWDHFIGSIPTFWLNFCRYREETKEEFEIRVKQERRQEKYRERKAEEERGKRRELYESLKKEFDAE